MTSAESKVDRHPLKRRNVGIYDVPSLGGTVANVGVSGDNRRPWLLTTPALTRRFPSLAAARAFLNTLPE